MRWTRVLLPLALVMQGILLSGCTLIGGGIGALIDKQVAGPVREVDALKEGTRINVQLKDGRQISGRYAGMQPRAEEMYAELYRARHMAGPADAPELGTEVVLSLASGGKLSGAYTGVGRLGQTTYIAVTDHGSGARRVPMREISGIGAPDGRQYDAGRLESEVAEGLLPALEVYALTTEAGVTETFGLEQIASIEKQRGRKALIAGLVIGAAVDAVVVVSALAVASAVDEGFGGW